MDDQHPQSAPGRQVPGCNVCLETFRTHRQHAKHALEAEHDAHLCCRQCLKMFKSTGGLAGHLQSPIHLKPRKAATTGKPPPAWSPVDASMAADTLVHRGLNYSRLSLPIQEEMQALLLAQCHAIPQLAAHGYQLHARTEAAADELATQESGSHDSFFRTTPARVASLPKRPAIALDCEMAGVEGGRSEAILVCAVDFGTGETLVQSLVQPSRLVADWRTHIHGITPGQVAAAVAAGQALQGATAARAQLWEYVDADTVLVGHSLQHDLATLGMVHRRVVDAAILAEEAVFGALPVAKRKSRPAWAIAALCRDSIGLEIRAGEGPDAVVHDCLEDVLAARELALHWLRWPEKLERWAAVARSALYKPGVRQDLNISVTDGDIT